jgi:type I restriction enzyme S subunit
MSQALPKDVPQTLRRWKRYSVYKDSGVDWLVEIPKHWEVMQLKRCLKSYDYGLSDNIRGEGTFKVLTMGHIQDGKVLIPEEGSLENAPKELLLEYDDLLFNRTNSRELVGKVGIFQGNLEDKVTFASYLVRLRTNNYAKPTYLNFLLNSQLILSKVRQDALLSINQANLNPTKYGQIRIPLPPIEEQQAIASFLDHETAKIDALIAKKERLIELLQEKRTAIISHAVTKGLDPTAPLKDSGVEWLGGIPSSWKLKRLKYLCSTTKGLAFDSKLFIDNGIPVVKVSDFVAGSINDVKCFISPEIAFIYEKVKLKAGDILMSSVGSKPDVPGSVVGQIARVPLQLENALLNQNIVRIDNTNQTVITDKFLFYVMQTDSFRSYLALNAHGTANQASLNIVDILNYVVCIPSLPEQTDITAYIATSTAKIDALIAKIREGIEKLKEYRTALISAAVTGKIDVRNEVAS